MVSKQISVFILLALVLFLFYEANQSHCTSCQENTIQIDRECMPVRSSTTIYRHLNCFCDKANDWRKISLTIRQLKYYRNRYGQTFPSTILGTKTIACSDDELFDDVFDDSDIILAMEQDTSKSVYDGALKGLFFSDGNRINYNIGLLNVDKENKQISRSKNKITVKYIMDYDEITNNGLISFSKAIHYDSSYQHKFKDVEYQLIRKETGKFEASIRYEDFGSRFYLKIIE